MVLEQIIHKSVMINAFPSNVWKALTDVDMMKEWMLDEDIEIITNWKIDGPIFIKGTLHWIPFENKGKVLQFEPEKTLEYTHLSSLSNLMDEKQNYVVYSFKLVAVHDQTKLSLVIKNFPTESIYQHLVFYWNTTLHILKEFIENKKTTYEKH